MTLMNIFAHIDNISYKSIRSKLRGILPGEIQGTGLCGYLLQRIKSRRKRFKGMNPSSETQAPEFKPILANIGTHIENGRRANVLQTILQGVTRYKDTMTLKQGSNSRLDSVE
jgi:hypothetical protein